MYIKEEHDDLVRWLNDAYAMENSIIEVLEDHVKDARDFPEIRQRLSQHLEETHAHADEVKSCIESLGGSVSTAKTALSEALSKMKCVFAGMYSDELVKNSLSEYMTEHLEIGCYHSLIAAAEECGENHVAEVCGHILEEEQRMADWVYAEIPNITRQHLAAHAMG